MNSNEKKSSRLKSGILGGAVPVLFFWLVWELCSFLLNFLRKH